MTKICKYGARLTSKRVRVRESQGGCFFIFLFWPLIIRLIIIHTSPSSSACDGHVMETRRPRRPGMNGQGPTEKVRAYIFLVWKPGCVLFFSDRVFRHLFFSFFVPNSCWKPRIASPIVDRYTQWGIPFAEPPRPSVSVPAASKMARGKRKNSKFRSRLESIEHRV